MGYTTDFSGSITIEPRLNQEECDYLNSFSESRRMDRENGPYYCGKGWAGQDREEDVRDYNRPPEEQPGLWCQWVVTEDGTGIEWDGNEKFSNSPEWMEYIIAHFLGENPIAREKHPELFGFLQGHILNGDIDAEGEESGDLWRLEVRDNVVSVASGVVTYGGEEPTGAVNETAVDEMIARTRVYLKHARERWDEQVKRSPHLTVSRETFEIFLRDLEETAGIR